MADSVIGLLIDSIRACSAGPLLAGGVWFDEAPAGTAFPYCVVFWPRTRFTPTTETLLIEQGEQVVAVYATSAAGAEGLARRVLGEVVGGSLATVSSSPFHILAKDLRGRKESGRLGSSEPVYVVELFLEAGVSHP